MDTVNQYLPYWPYFALGLLSLGVSASGVTLVVIYHKSLVGLAKQAKKGIFNRETLFWVVNITFMAFSAYHAAPFYASVSTGILGLDWFAPFVGLTAALVLDALVIVFQSARKRAGYKHDRKRTRMYMWYIFACCGLNTVANIYTNYQDFNASKYSNLWGWVINAGPTFLSLFPLFIMGMSNALEEMSSSTALDTLDVKKFKEDEEKRVGLVEAQAEYQAREVKADRRLIELEKMRKENERIRRGKPVRVKRVSRLSAWLWQIPLQDDYAKVLEVATQEHQKSVAEMQAKYDAQIVALTEQIALLSTTLTALTEASLSPNNRRRPNVASSDARTSANPSQVPTPERQTDKIPVVGKNDVSNDAKDDTKTTHRKPTPLFGRRREKPALRKVRNVVKRYPNLSPTEIAKKVQLSRSYVSDLLKEIEGAAV